MLVLEAFYSSYWQFLPLLLYIPLAGTDGQFIAMLGGSLFASGTAALLCTLSGAYSHAMTTHFRPAVQEELTSKYPYLTIA